MLIFNEYITIWRICFFHELLLFPVSYYIINKSLHTKKITV